VSSIPGTGYRCTTCNAHRVAWFARCGKCGAFGCEPVSITPVPVVADAQRAARVSTARSAIATSDGDSSNGSDRDSGDPVVEITAPTSTPIRITLAEVSSFQRIATRIPALDRVLGFDGDVGDPDLASGFVIGSIVLLGGDPGQGKSTLVIQACAASGRRVLYVSGEESIGQVAQRARRVGAATDQIWIVAETDVDAIIAHARALRPDLLAVDSIQTCIDPATNGTPGSVAQVRAACQKLATFAKAEAVTTILVGHVTKDGSIAGPKTLEHLVDAVLFLEQSEIFSSHRLVRAFKNRFGSTQEFGVLTMSARGLVPVEGDATSPATPAPISTPEPNLPTPEPTPEPIPEPPPEPAPEPELTS